MAERLMFWSAHAKELSGTVRSKIAAIIEQHAIEYDRDAKHYFCKPIMQRDGTPYNKTTYSLVADREFGFVCDCQGFQTKLKAYRKDPDLPKPHCAHFVALYEQFKLDHKARKEYKVSQAMLAMFSNEGGVAFV